uniref:adenosine deaminase n=1 Tax=Eptatretus burgeri TaxID=7764 RepID=A0A8C4N6S4_EPTBU
MAKVSGAGPCMTPLGKNDGGVPSSRIKPSTECKVVSNEHTDLRCRRQAVYTMKRFLNGTELDFNKPRVELHIHLDGAIRLETIAELAQRQGHKNVLTSVEDLRKRIVMDHPESLSKFLHRFHLYLPVIAGDKEAIRRVAYELVQDKAREGVVYLEVRYSPHLLATADVEPKSWGLPRSAVHCASTTTTAALAVVITSAEETLIQTEWWKPSRKACLRERTSLVSSRAPFSVACDINQTGLQRCYDFVSGMAYRILKPKMCREMNPAV